VNCGATSVTRIHPAFSRAARGRIAGVDIVGDWSAVVTRGLLRRFLHWTEHPGLHLDPADADRCNEQTNRAILETVAEELEVGVRPVMVPAA